MVWNSAVSLEHWMRIWKFAFAVEESVRKYTVWPAVPVQLSAGSHAAVEMRQTEVL